MPKRKEPEGGATKPPAKKRKIVTAKSLGLTKEEFDSVKPTLHKRNLKNIVKLLVSQVDDDWHDGWEAQGETFNSWVEALFDPLSAVIKIGIKKQCAFEHCYKLLAAVVVSCRDISAIPMRGSIEDLLDASDLNIEEYSGDVYQVIRGIWEKLLVVGAENDVAESLLYQCIRDAKDAGVDLTWPFEGLDDVEEPKLLKYLDNTDNWEHLSSTMRTFRMRRCIDRRYEGSPNRRTRDFSDQY